MRVEVEVAHHLAEHVPFRLGERQADVFVRQERVLAAPGFLERAIEHAFGRVGQFILRNIEIFHCALHRQRLFAAVVQSNSWAAANATG